MKTSFRSLGLAALLLPGLLGAASPLAVNLGGAGNFSILAKTGISTIGTTSIVGNIGVSPNVASSITGFGLIADSTNQFATSSLVNGRVYASNYSPPTPTDMTVAVLDMQAAYTDAAGRAPDATDLSAGSIGGLTFVPGVYKWGTGVNIATDIYLSGGPSEVWIFQVAADLVISSGKQVHLTGGALASNVFWQVGGKAQLNSGAVFNGNILCQTLIELITGAVLNGKALAQTAVTLQANAVTSSTSGFLGANPGQTIVFPSPARGPLATVVFKMNGSGRAIVRVWNDNGDLVSSTEEQKQSGTQRIRIAIKDFAPGVYLYRVQMNLDSGTVQRSDVQKFTVIK